MTGEAKELIQTVRKIREKQQENAKTIQAALFAAHQQILSENWNTLSHLGLAIEGMTDVETQVEPGYSFSTAKGVLEHFRQFGDLDAPKES